MNMFNRNQNVWYPLEGAIDLQSVMRQVYLWMVLGMAITAVTAFATVNTSLITLATNPAVFLIAIIAEFGLVIGISVGLKRLSVGMATGLFLAYAALNGFTLSMILLAFTSGTVFLAFATTAGLFGAMSVLGYTTSIDLSKMGTFLMMGVLGLVIAMVVNLFVNSGPMNLIVSVIGVLIFTALTAYDTQQIGRMASQMENAGDAGVKFGLFGALKLYLDFINMFLFMLQLFGSQRR